MLSGFEIALAGLAALAAGFINSLAGGGTLISFPALVALGIPEVAANVTNTVALCPGTRRCDRPAGGSQGQAKRLWFLIPAGIIGGITGSVLLLVIGAEIFRSSSPFLSCSHRLCWRFRAGSGVGSRRQSKTLRKKGDRRILTLPFGCCSVRGILWCRTERDRTCRTGTSFLL